MVSPEHDKPLSRSDRFWRSVDSAFYLGQDPSRPSCIDSDSGFQEAAPWMVDIAEPTMSFKVGDVIHVDDRTGRSIVRTLGITSALHSGFAEFNPDDVIIPYDQ
jgi:hypothetical protein